MDSFLHEQDEFASLGLVFFSNAFVRALDEYSTTEKRPDVLSDGCDKAIAALQRLHERNSGASQFSGLLSSADEITILAMATERLYGVTTTEAATEILERIQKAVGTIKTQKEFTAPLKEKIGDVIRFFECLAEEGLANCQQRALGDITEAERIWQHYAMS
jgi:hypothetical protein